MIILQCQKIEEVPGLTSMQNAPGIFPPYLIQALLPVQDSALVLLSGDRHEVRPPDLSHTASVRSLTQDCCANKVVTQ